MMISFTFLMDAFMEAFSFLSFFFIKSFCLSNRTNHFPNSCVSAHGDLLCSWGRIFSR